MSIGTTTRRRFGGRLPRSSSVLAAVIAAGLMLSGGAALAQSGTPGADRQHADARQGEPGAALAQSGTPGASPVASPVAMPATCNAPNVPSGTPEAMPAMNMATPAASPMASPVAAAATPPTGSPVTDQATVSAVEAGVSNVYACFNSGNYTGTAALLSAADRMSSFGSANLYTAAAQLEQLGAYAKFSNLRFIGVTDAGNGKYAVEYQIDFGKQIQHFTWVMAKEGDFWTVDQEFMLAPTTDLDTATVGVQAATDTSEYAYKVSPPTVSGLPAIMIHGTNAGKMDHEIVMFQVPDGYNAKDIATLDPTKMAGSGVSFVGQMFLAVGQQGDMLLEGLTPGTYVIASFLPASGGQSQAAKGMVATITVTAPATVAVPNVVASPGASPVATPAS